MLASLAVKKASRHQFKASYSHYLEFIEDSVYMVVYAIVLCRHPPSGEKGQAPWQFTAT